MTFVIDLVSQLVDACLSGLTQLIEELAEFAFLLRRHITELIEERGDLAFLTQILDAQRLEFIGISGLELIHLRQDFLYFIFQHRSCFIKKSCKGTNNFAHIKIFL